MNDSEDLQVTPPAPGITSRLGGLLRFADVAIDPRHVIMVLKNKVLLDNFKMYTIGPEAAKALRWALPAFSVSAKPKAPPAPVVASKPPQKPKAEPKKEGGRKYERVSDADVQLWADLYNRGFKYAEISRKVGRNSSTIQKTLTKLMKPKAKAAAAAPDSPKPPEEA